MFFETGPEGPELETKQVEKKSFFDLYQQAKKTCSYLCQPCTRGHRK